MRKAPFSLALMALLFLGSYMPLACACSCAVGTEEEQMQRADVVFVGVAVSHHDPNPDSESSPEDPSRQGDEIEWTFQVEHVEKGTAGQTEAVGTARGGNMCGFGFEEGSRYRVFATRQDDQSLKTHNCSGTRKMGDGETAKPKPSPTQPPPNSPPSNTPPPASPVPPEVSASPIHETPVVPAVSRSSGPTDPPAAAHQNLVLSRTAERPWLGMLSVASLMLPIILLLLTFASTRFGLRTPK